MYAGTDPRVRISQLLSIAVMYHKHGNFRHGLIFVDGMFDEILTSETLDMTNKKRTETLPVSHFLYTWQWLASIHGITAIPQARQQSDPRGSLAMEVPSREITEANTPWFRVNTWKATGIITCIVNDVVEIFVSLNFCQISLIDEN